MLTNDTPLMRMLTTNMRYLSERQGVLAQNIAHADTPSYQAQDLKKPDFSRMAAQETGSRMPMRATSAKHLSGSLSSSTAFAVMQQRNAPETSPTGNNVSIDDQMAKISETGAEYQLSSSLMKKFTQMYRSALGNR